ncbi:universal stress protein [Flexithrix dorotheae]|uniref:universal stress protein n=1 Tax=Flexithrix dorotheae TaxID=70993 RepID=UPI00036EF5CA|nr:universal stress protein [Flexithrix dorotheae]
MESILVPIDFSDNSMNALNYAIGLAQELNSTITLFNSYPIDVPMAMEYSSGAYMQSLNTEVKLDREKRLNEIISSYKTITYKDSDELIRFKLQVREGVAADSILLMIEEFNFDLLVMGTKGASGLEEVLLGSIAVSVMEKVKIPIIVVPEDAKFSQLEKIVYATDFDDKDIEIIDTLQNIGEYFNSEITCLHINTSPSKVEEEEGKLDALKRNYFFTPVDQLNFKIISDEKVEHGLQEYIEKNDIDLIVVTPKERGFIEGIFHKSLSRKLAFHAHTPILVAK